VAVLPADVERILEGVCDIEVGLALECEARRLALEGGQQERCEGAHTHGAFGDEIVDDAFIEALGARPRIDLMLGGEGDVEAEAVGGVEVQETREVRLFAASKDGIARVRGLLGYTPVAEALHGLDAGVIRDALALFQHAVAQPHKNSYGIVLRGSGGRAEQKCEGESHSDIQDRIM
jgi:hypothetical protein